MKTKYNSQVNNYLKIINQAELEIEQLKFEMKHVINFLNIRDKISNIDSCKENYKELIKYNNSLNRISTNKKVTNNNISKCRSELNKLENRKKSLSNKLFGKKNDATLDEEIRLSRTKLYRLYGDLDSFNILEQLYHNKKKSIEKRFLVICKPFNINLDDFYNILFDHNSSVIMRRKKIDLTKRIDKLSRIVSLSKVNIERINNGFYPFDFSICDKCTKCDAPMFCPHSINNKEYNKDFFESITPKFAVSENNRFIFPKTKINDYQ